jgi:hypothetical protein
VQSLVEKPGWVAVYNANWPVPSKFCSQGVAVNGKLVFSSTKRKGMMVSSAKTSEATETSKSDGEVISLWPRML